MARRTSINHEHGSARIRRARRSSGAIWHSANTVSDEARDARELMLYMEGYYDPRFDAFKYESFEFTDAAREADPNII